MFDDDKYLTDTFKKQLSKRSGSGAVFPKLKDKILVIKHDIIFDLNILNYE